MISEKLPKNGSMNIKRSDAKFKEIEVEILKLCPAHETHLFREGYNSFVTTFTSDIECFYGLMDNLDGTCRVDLVLTADDTEKVIEYEASLLKDSEKECFKRGAFFAERELLNLYILTFKKKSA